MAGKKTPFFIRKTNIPEKLLDFEGVKHCFSLSAASFPLNSGAQDRDEVKQTKPTNQKPTNPKNISSAGSPCCCKYPLVYGFIFRLFYKELGLKGEGPMARNSKLKLHSQFAVEVWECSLQLLNYPELIKAVWGWVPGAAANSRGGSHPIFPW